MARPAVQGSPVDFSAVAATTVTSGTVSGLQAGDLILVWVGMRSASARNVTSVTDTIAASGDLAWDHASDDDGGVSNNLRDAQNVQQTELWRAYVQPGDNTSGTITVNISASTSTLYCRAVVIRATAGGTLSIDQHASADQGATDTDPGTVSITPTVDSLVVAFSGNRQDQFVDFDGTLTAIGSPAEAGSTGDQMDWHAGYADGTASTAKTCTFDYAAVSEWIVQAVSVEETAAGGTTHEAAASISGTGSITVANRLLIHQRSASVAGTGTVTTAAFQRDHDRQASITGTGLIATAPERDLHRQAAITGTGSITTAPETDYNRQAGLTGTGTISAAGERDHNRQSSLTGTGSIEVRGEIEGQATTHERSASLSGTGSITVTGQRDLNRSASLTGTATISTAGLLIHQRSSALTGTGTLTVAATRRDHNRQADLIGVGDIAVGTQRVLLRSLSITGVGTITVTPFTGRAWTYGRTQTAQYDGTATATYDGTATATYGGTATHTDGGTDDWTYTPVS